MSTINLSNPRLRKYIRDTLEISKYGEPFATLIEEVFVREQYVLELNPAEFYEDLWNFKNSIQSIRFGECPSNAMGITSPSRKEIVLNFDFWQNVINNTSMNDYCTKLFETVAHECLHGMQQTAGTLENRAGGYNDKVKNRSHAIYEICTQGIAAKIAHDRNSSDLWNNTVLSGDGYQNEIFAVPLIAATFGVSERDVLKYGVRKREELIQVLDKNIGNQAKTAELVNKIELQLEYMHSLNYPDDNQIEYKNLSEQERKKQSTDVIINLVKVCQESLATRIKSTPLDFDKSIAIQYKYDQKKIIDTLRQEMQIYSYKFEKDYNEFLIASEFGENATYIREAINVFNQIGKNRNGIISIAPSLINAVRNEDFEYCQRMGIDLMANKTFSLVNNALDFQEKKAHEDYNDFNSWNNTQIFEMIYYGREIQDKLVMGQNRLNAWQTLYIPLGYQKMQDLRIALSENKSKYGVESKQYLLDFLDTPEREMDNFYSKFTRTGNARDYFKRSFRTDEDKEFLAKLIADRYIDRSFNPDGTPKKINTDREEEMQKLFLPTIKRHGRKQLEYSIANLLVNDDYQAFSDEGCRQILAIYGKKAIFDTISEPLLNEMLNQRRIIPEKNRTLQNVIFETEVAHPGTSAVRIAELIKNYKKNGMINSQLFSRAGRNELELNFNSQRDMEDMIGLICNVYSRNNTKIVNNMNNGRQNKNSEMLDSIIQSSGSDYFRENIIRAILYDDYSGFTNQEHINYVKSISQTELLEHISTPYIQNTQLIKENMRVLNSNSQTVTPTSIASMAKKQKMSRIRRVLNNLINNKQKAHESQMANEEESRLI